MTKRILLGSGGFRTSERIELLRGEMRRHFGELDRVLFIPYALRDHEGVLHGMVERGLHAGYQLDGIHRHADLARAVVEAKGIFVGGGNTFRLLYQLASLGLLDLIRDRICEGIPYLGISAGANVACPTIKTTNDMPIVQPPSLNALGVVPFQINPHYFEGSTYVKKEAGFEPHFGETRDERLAQFHEENATPVVGLWEGGLLRCIGDRVTLVGTTARLFRVGQPACDFTPGSDLSALLS